MRIQPRPALLQLAAIIGLSSGAAIAATQTTSDTIDRDDYARAARVLDGHLTGAIGNATVTPNWIDARRFWYRRDGRDGHEYVVIDSHAHTRSDAFDTARVRRAIQSAGGTVSDSLDVLDIADTAQGLHVDIALAGGTHIARCDAAGNACMLRERDPVDQLPAPDRQRWLFARGHDLWLREAGGDERRLTRDGIEHFAYGKLPDSSQMVFLRPPGSVPPVGVEWSPDGSRLFGTRIDERDVEVYPFVESVPRDGSFRPKVHPLRLSMLGEPGQPRQQVFVIDVASGESRVIDLGEGWWLHGTDLGWSRDHGTTYRLAHTAGWKSMALVEIDLQRGTARRVIEESADTSMRPHSILFMPPNIRVLPASGEAIWFSERSGWGHLYLYDLATGRLKRTLTRGDWLVRDVIEIDPDSRRLFFTAAGRERDRDPYYRHLYRVSLDGGSPRLLTPENAEHDIPSPLASVLPPIPGKRLIAPDRASFVDTYSTVDTPPVSVLRASDDGRVLMPLERADVSTVQASGWRPPARVAAKAADGDTDLYATVYLPPDFSPSRRYPVIHAIYGGPWTLNAPRSYAEAVATYNPIARASLAELGFIVVTVDARGTRARSRAFHDVGYGGFIEPALDDHIAVIKQLAERFGGFDLDRVGVYGHSFGGYVSTRALLSRPDFFKVAVSSAGPHNYQGFYEITNLLGLPEYGDGRHVRPTPQSMPDNYRDLDNASLAGRLRGKLLLAYGDLDESAYPAVTLQLADALIKANKRFDLLYLPNQTHGFFRSDRYYTQRMWDYFVEHLLGATPPDDFNLGEAAR